MDIISIMIILATTLITLWTPIRAQLNLYYTDSISKDALYHNCLQFNVDDYIKFQWRHEKFEYPYQIISYCLRPLVQEEGNETIITPDTTKYPLKNTPCGMAVSDLSNDKTIDIIIGVRATLINEKQYNIGPSPISVRVNNMSNDGELDIVVGYAVLDSIVVFLNADIITFSPEIMVLLDRKLSVELFRKSYQLQVI